MKPSQPHIFRINAGRWRRAAALLLCCCLLLTAAPVAAAEGHRVSFVNYDLTALGEDHLFSSVPAGARLYTAAELEQDGAAVIPEAGCTWYLYYPGGGNVPSFGPKAIPDPPVRDGYTFRDWAAQGASGDDVYTVTGDAVFVARYGSRSQYILNLCYQFDNNDNTVAAETSTTPYGWEEAISVRLPDLPSLAGLTPRITANSADQAVQAAVTALNGMFQGDGTFSGTLNQTFLDHCRTAGFAAWDAAAEDFQKDENGNVQINLPVTYTLTGAVTFQVAYHRQDPEDPTRYILQKTVPGQVTGTTRVSLRDLGLVETYAGFALTAASEEDAASYSVNANGTSTIHLYYDRNVHHLYYQMNGGNALEPVQLRYGQSIPAAVGQEHIRVGYDFAQWLWRDESGALLEEIPSVMPDGDLTLEAQWLGADTTVTLVYWLENANDDSYTVAGQQKISVTSGQTVGYAAPGGVSAVDFAINDYLSAKAMQDAGINDGAYFTFASADSSTQWAVGQEGGPKIAAGDGSTVINLGYTRNAYTLVFHLGRINGDAYQVATATNSNTLDPHDWQSGHGWSGINVHPILTMDGQEYFVDNERCYQITAKYGAYISDRWPVATDETVTEAGYDAEWWELYNNATYYLFTWGTHKTSPYFKTHSNKNIIGIYPTLSAELIIDPGDPQIPHHLVGYWSKSSSTKTHHYLFEAVPGADADNIHPISEYSSYWQVAIQGDGGWDAVQGLDFYEYSSTEVRTTNTSAQQNAPAFANVTYRYGCYSGNHVYFFYTYNNYTATYHENNPNLTDGIPARTESVGFHYLAHQNLAEELASAGFNCNYTPVRPYVSSYGNAHTFGGWYTDANLTFPVDWETENPVSSVNYYAKWNAPAFTLTLMVPGGTLYEDSLRQFAEQGYSCAVSTETAADGEVTTIYTVSGIPGGTRASEIVAERHGAQSSHSLAFDYWGYTVHGAEQRYLFDESQLVTADFTLTARWKTEYTGQYTVRYLTQEPQDNGLDTVEIGKTIYYRLYQDKTVSGVAVGSSVTEEARPVEGYLSQAGALTQVVAGASEQTVCFDFLYSPVSTSVTYHVHYVRDTGTDYGREAPPPEVIRVADDKLVTVDAASLNQSTMVREAAVMVGGYTPRDSWNVNFTLSAEDAQNHLYLYYVSNTLTVPFQVFYHIQAPDGTYPADAAYVLSGAESLGKVLQALDLAVGYGQYLEDPAELEALLTGHVLDEALTEAYLLLRGAGDNVLHLYMKNGTYAVTYHPGGDAAFPAVWDDPGDFLTAGTGGAWFQAVTYPGSASVPRTAPTRLGHAFTGWNTRADGGGDFYPPEALSAAPWYAVGGLSADVHLYAQWEAQQMVSFDLRGGSWTDDSGQFHLADVGGQSHWIAYVTAGGLCPRPRDPVRVLPDGTAYSFLGWTALDPDLWPFVDGENRIDLVEFESYRFDFGQAIRAGTVLYAVWDPDVATIAVRKTDTADNALAGASFTLERLQSTVSGSPEAGYTYTLVTDGSGAYVPDSAFPLRAVTSGSDGMGAFSNLPAGYYRLTETAAPIGYQGLPQPVLLFVPYGGQPEVWDPEEHPHVVGIPEHGDLTVQVQNVAQYSVTIDAPASLTLTYEPPDLIWNPETLSYEGTGGAAGQWQVSAPAGADSAITVTNTSRSARVQVEVVLQYEPGFRAFLPLSTLTGPDGFSEYDGADAKVLQGTLDQAAAAAFRLNVAGVVPEDAALPSEERQVGGITVRVSPTDQ